MAEPGRYRSRFCNNSLAIRAKINSLVWRKGLECLKKKSSRLLAESLWMNPRRASKVSYFRELPRDRQDDFMRIAHTLHREHAVESNKKKDKRAV